MKANYKLRNRLSYLIFGGLSVLTTVSCGSSQSTTADRDGIYGDSRYDRRSETSSSSAYYRDYFGTLHDETLVYTDAANYNSDSATAEKPREATGYAGWGNEPDNVTVNIYGNNWGWNNWYAPSWGWGWNNWYGPSWGWGWNSWYGPSWGIGWGWNSWGAGWYGGWGWNNWYGPGWGWGYNQWYSPHWYGHNHHYVYGGGRRGSYYNNGLRNNMGRSTYAPGTRTTRTTFSNNTSRTRFSTTRTQNYNNNSTIRNSGNTRNSNTGGIRQAPVRSNSGNVRQSTPTRSYSPASSGGTRSGGFSTGGGGGTRGGGGGGGGRR